LAKKGKRGDIVLEPFFSGPTVLVRKFKKSSLQEMIDCGVELLLEYSKDIPAEAVIKILRRRALN